jgi:poly(3-hydroxyalkanoate) synthetase
MPIVVHLPELLLTLATAMFAELSLKITVLVQVLEHAKEETVSIRRLETVEEVLKESDVCCPHSHSKLYILHDSPACVTWSIAQHSTVFLVPYRLPATSKVAPCCSCMLH